MIGNSNDEINYSGKLLTDRQVSNFHKTFANNSSANIKLSKTQICKIIQSGGFFGKIFGPLLKNWFIVS